MRRSCSSSPDRRPPTGPGFRLSLQDEQPALRLAVFGHNRPGLLRDVTRFGLDFDPRLSIDGCQSRFGGSSPTLYLRYTHPAGGPALGRFAEQFGEYLRALPPGPEFPTPAPGQAFRLRLTAPDRPGVLFQAADLFAEFGFNLIGLKGDTWFDFGPDRGFCGLTFEAQFDGRLGDQVPEFAARLRGADPAWRVAVGGPGEAATAAGLGFPLNGFGRRTGQNE